MFKYPVPISVVEKQFRFRSTSVFNFGVNPAPASYRYYTLRREKNFPGFFFVFINSNLKEYFFF